MCHTTLDEQNFQIHVSLLYVTKSMTSHMVLICYPAVLCVINLACDLWLWHITVGICAETYGAGTHMHVYRTYNCSMLLVIAATVAHPCTHQWSLTTGSSLH